MGATTAIVLSPFHCHIFLSAGIDGYLKLRSSMQKHAIASMENGSDGGADRICVSNGLYAADWSKIRPLVFASAGDGGVVRVHDLGSAQSMVPVVELKPPLMLAKPGAHARILTLKFNHKQRDFLACGDAFGHVHIWQLSWELSNAIPYETEVLQAYIERVEQTAL